LRNRACSHRSYNDYMSTLADAGAALWGTAGEYAYETYSHLRARLYQELPSELPIVIGLCAYGHCKSAAYGAFPFRSICSGSNMRWVWSRLWSFDAPKPLVSRARRRGQARSSGHVRSSQLSRLCGA